MSNFGSPGSSNPGTPGWSIPKGVPLTEEAVRQYERNFQILTQQITDLPGYEDGKALVWDGATGKLKNRILDSSAIALPGGGRTVPSVTAFLNNNAKFNVKDYGAKGDNATDDTNAFRAAVTAAGTGGTIVVPYGNYVLSGTITLLDFQRVVGEGFFLGAGGSPKTQLKWAGISGTTPGIMAGVNNSFSALLFRGPGGIGNTCPAVYSANGHPRFYECQFYSWYLGNDIRNAYYSVYFGCEFAYCRIGVKATGCYNMHHFGTTFRGSFSTVGYFSNCVVVTDQIRHLAMHGGSAESYDSSGGFQIPGSSLVDIFGMYFESSEATSASFGIAITGGSTTVNLIGNQVYLSNANRWFNAGGLNGVTLNSRGNNFVCSAASVTNPQAYNLPTNGTAGTVDISGDDWSAVSLAAASYVGGTMNAGPKANFRISAPTGVTAFLAEHDFVGRPFAMARRSAAPTTPMVGGVYMADGSTWNPLNRVALDPYLVLYDGTRYIALGTQERFGSAVWDPPSVAAGAQTTTAVGVTGAALGDQVAVSFSNDIAAMQLWGYVSGANTVTVVLRNGTAGAIDLASGTLRVVCTRR